MGRPPRAGVWVSVHQPGTAISSRSSVPVIHLVAKEQLLLSMLSHAFGCGSDKFLFA